MDNTMLLYALLALLGLVVVAFAALYTLLILSSPAPMITHSSEKFYLSHSSPKSPRPLTKLDEEATHDLTVVVPAYNEVGRLEIMLDACVEHLGSAGSSSQSSQGKKSKGKSKSTNSANSTSKSPRIKSYELLIVDDGSIDSTSAHALQLAAKYPLVDIRVVTLEKNLGKGGAVRHGMLFSGGEMLLMVDADGATRFSDLDALLDAMEEISGDDGEGVVVGSRAHLVKTEAVVKRSPIRNVLMYGLHTLLRIAGVGHIRDTQCGFKLFSRPAARRIFPYQRLPTWIFDVELLLIAKYLGIPVAEVPVEWHEVPGSKLHVLKASIQMARDLLVVRGNWILGRWGVDSKIKVD